MDSRILLKAVLAFISGCAALILFVWLGVPYIQTQRADTKIASANNHIEEANQLMSRMGTDRLSADTFTSLDNINQAREAAAEAGPLLEQALGETQAASRDAREAAGLASISRGYHDYLLKKAEIAELRGQQLVVLQDSVAQLAALYEAGGVVFTSLEEMDRLLGQFQVAMSKVQTNPAEASASLKQTSQEMLQVKQRLDNGYASTGFYLLASLSQSVKDYADLSSIAAQLADAAGSGDQAQAQAAAINLERQLMSTGGARNELDNWWQTEIEPREKLYLDLQSQMETLDTEASELYETR